ncbi:MAG: HAMP domain-containing histidine kinase [Coprococcus sp.]|nr:HAMP domain-containing histidine kinase [Coprococcus sp.]
MKFWPFLKDKSLLLLLHLVCMSSLSVFLKMTGYGDANVILILVFWVLILTAWLLYTFIQRRNYFDEIEQLLRHIDQRYLLGELLPRSFRLEDKLYRKMIHSSNKAVIERIREIEDAQKNYREYIESWIHEVKAPITSISLLCDNGRKAHRQAGALIESLRTISIENQKIENYVEMALYYARSENVYKDFMIRQTSLQETVETVLKKNKLLFIENQVRAKVSCPDIVFTDRKWILFILNQIVLNSVKYCCDSPFLSIYTTRDKAGVTLTVQDNGTGILPEELPRIFEKGFTGSNGRRAERSTGMGLYLCQRLCVRLGLHITAESDYGEGTRILIRFPLGSYHINTLSKM